MPHGVQSAGAPAELIKLPAAAQGVIRYTLPVALDPPHRHRVFSHFKDWTDDGVLERLGVRLRRIVREQVGRNPEPTACAIDSQSVKTAHTVPMATQGVDPGKKIGATDDFTVRRPDPG